MQTTWKSFTSLTEAIAGTRGNTQFSFGLVQENLFVGETAEWVATAAINDFGDWQDGCVVLTDQRLFAAYVDPTLQQTYGNMVPRVPVPRISQFQGGGDLATFAVDGIPLQAIALRPEHFATLQQLLESTDMSEYLNVSPQPVAEDPMAALTKVKALLEAGLITQEEYDSKKTEILARL